MNLLSPSILSADFSQLGAQIQQVDAAGAQMLHIDVMDGIFVPSITYGMPVIKSIRKVTPQIFDVHLMIEKPERYIEAFADCGADMITFHFESTDKADEVIDQIHARGLKAGISIKPGTSVEVVRPFLDKVDMILVMTVEPGFGGQSYINSCTEKIRCVRKMVQDCGRSIYIQVDGGINRENLKTVLDAGANVIVAGSAIFKGDINSNTAYFLKQMVTKE
ncbi:MAG TPA: ribulose-phosphate 3-epimerase [Lachnospiraceae bacterium]|nr:ribulose-phosphate 3-epimerase [Lachnospiraceae bacterium]